MPPDPVSSEADFASGDDGDGEGNGQGKGDGDSDGDGDGDGEAGNSDVDIILFTSDRAAETARANAAKLGRDNAICGAGAGSGLWKCERRPCGFVKGRS